MLILTSRPAQAQGSGGWYAVQCDAQGNPTSSFFGTETGLATNTYPPVQVAADCFGFYPIVPDSTALADQFYDNTIGDHSPADCAEAGNDYIDGYGHSGTYHAPDGSSSSVNGSVTVHWDGQVSAYYKEVWYGAEPPAVPMPDHIDFLLNTELHAYSDTPYGSSGLTSGLSATSTVSDSQFNETATASAGDAGAGSRVPDVVGYHLVRAAVDPSTGIAEVYLKGTVDWTASNSVPYMVPASGSTPPKFNGGTSALASGNIYVGIQQDNREVSISCPAIEDSYYKAMNPDPTHGDRYQHLRDPNTGAIVTDSVAVYSPTAVFSTMDTNKKAGAWIALDTFIANTPGFVNPKYSWSSDSNGGNMADVDLTQRSVNINWFFGSSDKLPVKSSVRVDVTDGPPSPVPATAANTFGITWHLPYEAPNPVPYSVVPGKYQLQPARLGPVSHDQTELKKPTPAQHIDWEAAINGASVVAKVGGQEEIAGGLEIIEAIAKIAKPYTDVDADSNTETGATNNSETWNDTMTLSDNDIYGGGNIPDGLDGDPDGYLYCDMYIYQVVHYKDKYWYADGYNSNGYDGTSNNVVYLRNIDGVYDEFYYLPSDESGGNPIPPTPKQPAPQ